MSTYAYVISRVMGLEGYKDKTTAIANTLQETVYRVLLAFTTFTFILWMSIFLYASFYYTYMPAQSHIRPIHLNYQPCGRISGICNFPSAEVTLTERQQLLMVGQPYKVVVELEMPESPQNFDAGMFMVCAELRGSDGQGVANSCRSAMLHYKSWLHSILSTFVYFPFLLSGSAEEKQLIAVQLYGGFTESEQPATKAFVEIKSQHVQIYQAYLKIHADFNGLRYFMFHWPLLAGALGVSINFFFIGIIAFLCWFKFFTTSQTLVQIGYDGNAAKAVDDERRASVISKDKEKKEKSSENQKALENSTSTGKDDVKSKIEDEEEDEISKEKRKIKEDAKNKEQSNLNKEENKEKVILKEKRISGSDEFEVLEEDDSDDKAEENQEEDKENIETNRNEKDEDEESGAVRRRKSSKP